MISGVDFIGIATKGLDLILDAYRAAQAANDAAAIADLDALLGNHEIGRRIADKAKAAQAVIDAGRARLDTPVMGVPVVAPAPTIAATFPQAGRELREGEQDE